MTHPLSNSAGRGPVLGNAELIAFILTSDAARAKAFYGGTLGYPVLSEDSFAVVFDVNGTVLRAAVSNGPVAAAPHTVLGWRVDEIESSVAALAAAGIAFERYDGMGQDEHGIWHAPGGAKVAWFKDPDGNVLSLSQHPDAA